MSSNSSNWCPEIYRNLFVDRFNQDSIRVAPCCAAKSATVPLDTFNFNTNDYLNKLRENTTNNLRNEECKMCWEAEDIGHTSRRHHSVARFDKPDYSVVLKSIDHSATWACNLGCIMCGPVNSSTWAKELNLSKNELTEIGRQFQKLNNFVDKLDLSAVDRMYFNGGEPLINNEHLDVLTELNKQTDLSNVRILYSTNGTIYPSEKAFELWNKAKDVLLLISVDATGQAFNYIRYPGKWDEVSKNILRIKTEHPNITIGFIVTVGNYNVLEMRNIWNWFTENINSEDTDFNFQIVNTLHFKLHNMPREAKLVAIEKLDNIEPFAALSSYIKSTLDVVPETKWIKILDKLDARRGTSWRTELEIGKYC